MGEHADGTVKVLSVQAEGTGTRVTLAVDNTAAVPMRVSQMEVIALDPDGFVVEPAVANRGELTVPPRSKDKADWLFEVPPDKIDMVRLWGRDLERL
jgi:hypothetical protein